MPRFLKRLDECGIPYRLREQHTNGEAHVRRWASNPGPMAGPGSRRRALRLVRMHQAQGDNNTTLTLHPGRPSIEPWRHTPCAKRKTP